MRNVAKALLRDAYHLHKYEEISLKISERIEVKENSM